MSDDKTNENLSELAAKLFADQTRCFQAVQRRRMPLYMAQDSFPRAVKLVTNGKTLGFKIGN